MNAIISKRSVLAAIVGSSMAFGLSAPLAAHSAQPRDLPSQEQQDRKDKQDEDARAARKSERQEQADSRLRQAQAALAQSQENDRRRTGQSPSRPAPAMQQREQSQQRERSQQREQSQQRAFEPQQQRQLDDGQGGRYSAPRGDRYDRVAVQPKARDDRDERMVEPPLGQPRPSERPRQSREDYGRDSGKHVQARERDRLPRPQQQQLISQQRQQAERFSRQDDARRATAERYGRTLQQQHRNSQYRYQQEYYDRMHRYQSRYDWRTYNYYNDPYFYTAPRYRYYRGGSYYSINIYGANLLQQAINFGYGEGLRAGRADRMDGWRFDYRSSYAYRDANYGYYGFYVNQSEYNYYFRQGFQRGYADGYYGRRRYGRYYNGADVLLAPVMSAIFSFQFYR